MSDVLDSIERNNLKLTADKILQGLKKVRNEPSKSRRRWIWELLQNAKDVPNRFGRVRVKVELTDEELRFSHNGDPFTVQNITGLIQQVSSKASGGTDEEVTGKFGTGFISTHLLSERVVVQGVTIRPSGKAKQFEIELDRSGRTSEELMPHIEQAIERIKSLDSNPEFVDLPAYATKRTQEDLDTTLTYRFQGKQGLPAAQVGIDDLRRTLPFTLANVPKIEAVSVVDESRGIEVHFACDVQQIEEQVRAVTVTIQDGSEEEEVHFLCWDAEDITLMVELSDPDTKALKPNFGEHPTLYRQFPLVGSEKFHWPFMVNGDSFFPTEERDGLYLNSEEDVDSLENRALLERAVDEAVAFSKWLIDYGVSERYVMTYTRIPDVAWEGEAKTWYKGLQARWRKELRPLALVENESGAPTLLDDVFVPNYGESHEVRETFWALFAPFVGYDKVPCQDRLHDWIAAVGPSDEVDAWGDDFTMFYDLRDLFSMINECGTLDGIELDACEGRERIDTLTWLMNVLMFAVEQGEVELLSESAVVPNHKGELLKLSELYEEDAEAPIPDVVLDVLERLGSDWRKELVHRSIVLSGLQHQRRGLRDAAEVVASYLEPKKKTGTSSAPSFADRKDALDILFEILSWAPPGAKDSFQRKLHRSAAFLFNREEVIQKIEDIEEFNFGPAIRQMIAVMHERITELGTVDALVEATGADHDQVINWLDEHLRLLQGNSEHEHYLKEGDIIPNRKGVLMAFEDIHAYGTEETPLDGTLVEVLRELDAEQDWDEVLVADGIGISLPNTRTMDELGGAIQKAVATIKLEPTSIQEHRESLLQLIDWCEQNEVEASRHLAGFLPHKDGLFFELVAKGNIGSSVIRMLGSDAGVSILKRIADSGMDASEVDKLLALGEELGSLSAIIDRAEELVEELRDFEYKKQLGGAIEKAFMDALRAAGMDAEVRYKGTGSHDVEVIGRKTRKTFRIEVKSVSAKSNEPLKMAASQASALINDPNRRALCVLERTVEAERVTPEHIRKNLKFRVNISSLLQKGLDAHESLREVMNDPAIDVQLLGEPRIRLERNKFLANASGFEALVQAIRRGIA